MRKWYGYIAVLIFFLLISIIIACFLKAGLIEGENLQIRRAIDEIQQDKINADEVLQEKEMKEDDSVQKEYENESENVEKEFADNMENIERDDLQVPMDELH